MAPKRKCPTLQRPNSKDSSFVECPACKMKVISCLVNNHLDWDCLARGDMQCQDQFEYLVDPETTVKRNEDVVPSPTSIQTRKKALAMSEPHADPGDNPAFKKGPFQEKNASQSCEIAEVNTSDKKAEIDESIARRNLTCGASTASSMNAANWHSKFISSPPPLKAPKGHLIVEDFISVEEEHHLLRSLDMDLRNPWKLSTFNGLHMSKAYGLVTDLKRRLVQPAVFEMPKFLEPITERMRATVVLLKDFWPNETNAINYCKENGHWLKPHVDDRQLSGTVLVNLSLCGDCKMTYTRERGPDECYKVLLRQRSIQILTRESRYNFTHSIQNQDLLAPRRVSLTFRQSVWP